METIMKTGKSLGYLYKKGHLRQNWKCRYFVLHNQHLHYFKHSTVRFTVFKYHYFFSNIILYLLKQ